MHISIPREHVFTLIKMKTLSNDASYTRELHSAGGMVIVQWRRPR